MAVAGGVHAVRLGLRGDRENRAGLYSPQMDRSFRWGMTWFIFPGDVLYRVLRCAVLCAAYVHAPWLAGEGLQRHPYLMLWPNFRLSGRCSTTRSSCFPRPEGTISRGPAVWSTQSLLVSSSVTITIAHHALRKGHRSALKIWLAMAVAAGPGTFWKLRPRAITPTKVADVVGLRRVRRDFLHAHRFHGAT